MMLSPTIKGPIKIPMPVMSSFIAILDGELKTKMKCES